jgi:WD40 repeat protein
MGAVCSVSFSPDGKRVASGSDDGTVRVWDLATGQAVVLKGHKHVVSQVCFSPDGKRLASASWDKTVRIWDLATSRAVMVWTGWGPARSVSFSPVGNRLAIGGFSTPPLVVWDLATRQAVVLQVGQDTGFVSSVTFSPDNKYLASGHEDGFVRVWELATGKPVVLINGHKGRVYDMSFSLDGKRLATCAADLKMRIWDLATQQGIALQGHTSTVSSVSFSPDGKRLASASSDRTVRVWEAMDTGHLFHLREAASSEANKEWFAAAFHLGWCIQEERQKLALEAVSGGTSRLALGTLVTINGLRALEGRVDLASLQQRLRNARLKMRK